MTTADKTLNDNKCSRCGCYCFGSDPYPWKQQDTPRGKIKLCITCAKDYADNPVDDPVREYKLKRLEAALSYARREVRRLERAIDELG